MKYILYILFSIFLLGLAACEDELLDLNENPNEPTEVTPDVLLTAATRNAVNAMVTESFLLGNNAAQLTAKTLRTEVDVYNWNAFPTVWSSLYEALADFEAMEDLAAEDGNDRMLAVALTFQTWCYSTLTDAYGDIPYTDAITGVTEDDFTPSYDRQENIYLGPQGLLAQLALADSLLENGSGMITGDILYNGDVMNWRRFANSLHLRLLMHASNQIDDIGVRFNQIVTQKPLMESNADNAVLEYLGGFPNEHPIISLKQGDFDAVVMSNRLVEIMDFDSLSDPRLGEYARPSNINSLDTMAPVYNGAENGSENPDACPKNGSRLGLAYYDYPGHPTTDDKADGIIMTYAEVAFLLAEAAHQGWFFSNPETHYKDGIQASMDYYDVNYGDFGWNDFDDFYNNSPGVAYDGELETIWQQKWIALYFHGLEPYFEVRRWMYESGGLNAWSAIPFLYPTCQNINDDVLPARFLYPGEEQTLNAENYQQAIGRYSNGDDQNSRMWLIQ